MTALLLSKSILSNHWFAVHHNVWICLLPKLVIWLAKESKMAHVPKDVSPTKWHSRTLCFSTLFSFMGTPRISAMSLFLALPALLIIRSRTAYELVHWSPSTTEHDPDRTNASIIKNNVKSAAFLRNYRPPATSGSRSAKGYTLLIQLWFWLFVQETNCTVVAAGLSSSVVRTRYIDVPVLHPIRGKKK